MLKRILKWLWELLEVVIIIYVIFITSCILSRNKYGYTEFFEKYTFVTVNENNQKLLPTHNPGDLLIVKNQKFDINKGDLIYYYITVDEEYVVKSGVVESKVEDDVSALYILNDSDKTSVPSNRVLGKYVSTYPGKGDILETLESRIGFLFLVLLPILIVFIYQVYQLVVVAKYETVEDEEKSNSKKTDNKDRKIEEAKPATSKTKQSETKDESDIEFL